MTLVDLTHFIMRINGAIDCGRYATISVAEVEHRTAKGDLFPFLRSRFGEGVDLSGWDFTREIDLTELFRESFVGGVAPKTWGISRSGLCLLVAWTNELIQQRAWEGS